ncbi:MAG: flagellin [Terracidiphilus sp.]
MSLGVLNNLSAVYAENNLSNTNNSLSKTLQQLSSGSKINSGADDAAGLSLVDGLQANQQALTQSQTNAQEGVGLLQVADGALSQVTTLLNRAVTLATEASNGTLNNSQDTAANQEYQSILSEISNIGSTTTYNDSTVFNSNTNIYTGDSSTAGSAIDALNIRALSSSNVGDSGGTMAYSTGANNAFIDLSHSGTLATANDALGNTGGNGTNSIDVTYMTTGGSGANQISDQTATITVGAGTNYADTVQGMISAINNSGLGLTASFTTATQAGTAAVQAAGAGHSTDTGIEISGVGSGVAGAANGAAAPGVDGTLANTFTAGTLTINGKSITLGTNGSTDTEAHLAAYINAGNYGVEDTGGVLTSLTKATITTSALAGGTYTAGSYYTAGVTEDATNALSDAATTAAPGTPASDTNGVGGVATISYSDSAGQSLAATDLSSQSDAEAALTSLNTAITDVAAQDGYVGAQINTLNAVSQVISTQQENVQSAQNAVQATDYAQASSNMSKYEILSQTGISALAQANSVQQEVTKLLQ